MSLECLVARCLLDAGEQIRERLSVDLQRRSHLRGLGRRDEQRPVQPLVEEAIAVAIPSQHLHPRRALADEDVQRPATRVLAQQFARYQRQPVERPPHVLRLGADQDPRRRR